MQRPGRDTVRQAPRVVIKKDRENRDSAQSIQSRQSFAKINGDGLLCRCLHSCRSGCIDTFTHSQMDPYGLRDGLQYTLDDAFAKTRAAGALAEGDNIVCRIFENKL
jgi:hypothetical protein